MIIMLTLSSNASLVQAAYNISTADRVLRMGDEGADAAVLPQKMADLDLYTGSVDGIFGSGTERAVREFQQRNELAADGIAGEKTIKALPGEKLISRMDASRDDILLLARIIHGEARGEDFKGMVAVGAVILNRVESGDFPNSIREVILQQGQFSCLIDGQA